MELITGGKYQGKRKYALNTLRVSEDRIVEGLNEKVRELLKEGKDPESYAKALLEEKPDAVIICDEVGCGVIPLEEKDREYRIAMGRLECFLSERAEHVYRVAAGLGIKLK